MAVNFSNFTSSSGFEELGEIEIDPKILVPLNALEKWGYGLLFVTVINLSSVMGIMFFPLMKKSFYAVLMRIMIGLAIGSLSGSALFHLIPQAFGMTVKTHPNYITVAAFVWLAIWMVMILECSIKIGVKMRSHSRVKKEHKLKTKILLRQNNYTDGVKIVPVNGCADHAVSVVEQGQINSEGDASDSEDGDEVENESDDAHLDMNNPNLPVYRSTLSLNKVIDKIQAKEDENGSKKKEIKTVAWIIIIGDSLHNFIDGVSIGAGFVQSFSTGAILSLAIMCEEFPHELGDFAILINSGLTVKRALLFNFLSALTCYLGLALGLLLGKIEWANLIFAFAAGIFLYVALGDMVPEVTSLIDEVSDVSPKKAWKVMLDHNLGIIIGILILFLLAKFQP